jgi:hypothetical protein
MNTSPFVPDFESGLRTSMEELGHLPQPSLLWDGWIIPQSPQPHEAFNSQIDAGWLTRYGLG